MGSWWSGDRQPPIEVTIESGTSSPLRRSRREGRTTLAHADALGDLVERARDGEVGEAHSISIILADQATADKEMERVDARAAAEKQWCTLTVTRAANSSWGDIRLTYTAVRSK